MCSNSLCNAQVAASSIFTLCSARLSPAKTMCDSRQHSSASTAQLRRGNREVTGSALVIHPRQKDPTLHEVQQTHRKQLDVQQLSACSVSPSLMPRVPRTGGGGRWCSRVTKRPCLRYVSATISVHLPSYSPKTAVQDATAVPLSLHCVLAITVKDCGPGAAQQPLNLLTN